MADDDKERMGFRWFFRETVFLVLGAVLWGLLGWRILWGVIPLALALTLVGLRRRGRPRRRAQ